MNGLKEFGKKNNFTTNWSKKWSKNLEKKNFLNEVFINFPIGERSAMLE
jgi:hypothetical protein